MTEPELTSLYLAAQMLRCGRTAETRELLDKMIRDYGVDPPPDPQMRRAERERARAA